jgi:uncharacterized repeat protein (TIGR04076 family)
MADLEHVSLKLDLSNLSEEEYHRIWAGLYKIEIKCVEKIGQCKHNLGDTFVYETPYKKPAGVCSPLLHVLDLYTWRTVLGYPSWNEKDRSVFRIHCPDPTGTIWEMKRII